MWISINDEMPTTSEDVLVTDGNVVAVAYMNEITHWCDVPELP